MLLTLLLLSAASCQDHQLPNQRLDAASVRRVDSAWSAAYVRGDTTFLRCLLAADYRGFSSKGVLSDANEEVAKAGRHGKPDAPLDAFPKAEVQVHGATGIVGGLVPGKRWTDIYVFEKGVWHAILSVDQPLPNTQ
jgi:hypothetical protein